MRLPIILMLLTVILLPADLRGFADDVAGQLEVATATVADVFQRDEPATRVAAFVPVRQVPSFN